MKPIVVHSSPRKLVKILGAGVLVLGVSVALAVFPKEIAPRVVGVVGIAFFGVCLVSIVRTFFDRRPRLVIDDRGVFDRGYSIAFEIHGAPATVRRATKALRNPTDPRRRLGTRELIPQVIEALEAEGAPVTNAAIAAELGCSPSSVAQMRNRLASEG